MAKNADPDQIAPLKAVWLQSVEWHHFLDVTLFQQIIFVC